MYTIKENVENLLEIKKSKFITRLYKVYSVDEALKILKDVREEHKDATHCCYAYRIGNVQKFSDDGEPGGTAGLPMMDMMQKKEIDYVLCVVIRYFGGIKLGAGGLVRAYANSVREALQRIELKELSPGYLIEIKANYENNSTLSNMINKEDIISLDYGYDIVYKIRILKDDLEKFNRFNPIILEEILIEKNFRNEKFLFC
ncbi:MAG: YigZ family protein [Firmicutes bacterium]|nr:YigZ family protein [Bacillota bacterium]